MAAGDRFSGKDGKLTFNSIVVDIRNWTLSIEQDVKNTTDSQSAANGWEENIAGGFSRFTGSAEAFIEEGTAFPTPGTSAAIKFTVDDSFSTTDREYTGTAILTRVGPAVDVFGGEAARKTLDFVGTGALAEVLGT